VLYENDKKDGINMNYGIQMYSLRDLARKDMELALKEAAEMGYKEIEFAGFMGHTADEIRAMLDKYGLVCCGSHSLMSDLINDFDATVKYHKTIGNTKYIIPGVTLDTRDKLETFIAQCNEFAPKLHAEGIELGFHNHHVEFLTMPEGFQSHKELEERTDIFFQLDTYWVFVAKLDPIAAMERLKGRIPCIHLKDGTPDGIGCSLGQGEAPIAAVRAKAIEMGISIVVESEGMTPSGKEEVERCITYLKTLD